MSFWTDQGEMDAATLRTLREERDRMMARLRLVRLIGSGAWLAVAVFVAYTLEKGMPRHLPFVGTYFALAAALYLGGHRISWEWLRYSVAVIDVPAVFVIQTYRVAASTEKLANAMFSLAVFTILVGMTMMTL